MLVKKIERFKTILVKFCLTILRKMLLNDINDIVSLDFQPFDLDFWMQEKLYNSIMAGI